MVLEKTLESPLDCEEIQPVHSKGDQSWVFLGRTDFEAEIQYFGHLMGRADSFEKALMLGKTEGRRRRGQQRMKWLDDITNSRSSLRLMSIESMMPSNHLILCQCLLLLPSILPSISLFQWVGSSHWVT